ncbi:uncharacterized protein IL334_005594 [Kwoniella shivajii]|uniref:Uncharacterized protein n=1 Tax=Kwoniella shivajii TaxID=564305 RepID=A0ABZ1D6P0_9TREE|nr:hypothetical protein IL334_005594 [Kwoniella shivajii]
MVAPNPIGFTPKHTQPFTLEEAMGLEIETLVTEIKRLENSIQHLQRTQSELKSYLDSEREGGDGDGDGDGDGEIEIAFKENEDTISSQIERIAIIKIALMNKLGSDARLEHYGLSIGSDQSSNSTSNSNISSSNTNTNTTRSTNTPIPNGNPDPGRGQVNGHSNGGRDAHSIIRDIVQTSGGGSSSVNSNSIPYQIPNVESAGESPSQTQAVHTDQDQDGLHL